MYELETEAAFDSAHFLADYYGKCENLHGHRWRVVARIGKDTLGEDGTERDVVCDFGRFKEALRTIVATLDHTFLIEENTLQQSTIAALESEGFSLKILPFRTTAENLAHYLFDELCKAGFPVTEVEVDETPNNRAIYRP